MIPSRWATAIHRDWNARYLWPRFVTAVPSEFFAAVPARRPAGDVWITPQTRDMNPVYTGKDVTYIDTKQAQRAAETAVLDGERLATLAWLAGASYPAASLDKAWRQLVFGAHHDAITGTEGDQVYLDLLAGWREAWERGATARDAAAGTWPGWPTRPVWPAADGDRARGRRGQLAVVRPVTAMATVGRGCRAGPAPAGSSCATTPGAGPVPGRGHHRHRRRRPCRGDLTFRAADVPGVRLPQLPGPARRPRARGRRLAARARRPTAIENDRLRRDAPTRPAAARWPDPGQADGTELLRRPGGNELVLQPEHPAHPRWAEGPWLLCPAGPGTGSAAPPGAVRAERCPVGSRLIARLRARRAARHPGDAAVGRRRPGRVPHPRRRLDRAGPPAAGRVPGRRAGRPAGLPDRGLGDRPAARRRGHRRGRALVHAGQSRRTSGSASAPPPGSRSATAATAAAAAGHRRRRGGPPPCPPLGRA